MKRAMPRAVGGPAPSLLYQVVADRGDSLRRFFEPATPNAPMLHAFLEGRVPGRAFIDHPREPSQCVVAINFRCTFFGGAVTPEFFAEAVSRLRRDEAQHVVWPARRGIPRSGPVPDRVVGRIEYGRRDDPFGARLRDLRRPVAGVEARRIDAALLRRCLWRGEIERTFGSAGEFLAHGMGFCLLRGETIVAEAYGSFWGLDRLEIATITHPDHRGQGHAPAACAHLIAAGEGLGFSTYWSCDADNAASHTVAARLGFCAPRPYRLLGYDQLQASSSAASIRPSSRTSA